MNKEFMDISVCFSNWIDEPPLAGNRQWKTRGSLRLAPIIIGAYVRHPRAAIVIVQLCAIYSKAALKHLRFLPFLDVARAQCVRPGPYAAYFKGGLLLL